MDSAISVLVALVGAGVGAYFAIVKSQKERLWLDRYETLRDVVLFLDMIESHFSSSHVEQMGVQVISQAEREKLAVEWPTAKHSLGQHVSRLRLLFKETHISDLRAAIDRLNSSFFDLYQGEHIHSPELHEAVAERATEATECAIRVAQRHCL